jgi:hypothetical protein
MGAEWFAPNEFGGWYAKPVQTGTVTSASTRFNGFSISGVGFNRCPAAVCADAPNEFGG